MTDRVCVFIDGANLFFALINKGITTKLDYEKLVGKLVGDDRRLFRAYYYDAPIDQTRDPARYRKQQSFFSTIRRLPYFETRFGRIHKGHQKGVDVWLAVDMIDFAFNNRYDTAILVSGDSDLLPAVEAVKQQGKHVELAFFRDSRQLQDACDIFVELDQTYLDDCQ